MGTSPWAGHSNGVWAVGGEVASVGGLGARCYEKLHEGMTGQGGEVSHASEGD